MSPLRFPRLDIPRLRCAPVHPSFLAPPPQDARGVPQNSPKFPIPNDPPSRPACSFPSSLRGFVAHPRFLSASPRPHVSPSPSPCPLSVCSACSPRTSSPPHLGSSPGPLGIQSGSTSDPLWIQSGSSLDPLSYLFVAVPPRAGATQPLHGKQVASITPIAPPPAATENSSSAIPSRLLVAETHDHVTMSRWS